MISDSDLSLQDQQEQDAGGQQQANQGGQDDIQDADFEEVK